MDIRAIGHDFSVCKIRDLAGIDLAGEFVFIGKTDEEISLVCLTERAPVDALAREDGWKAFRIEGVLDFSLVGILSGLSSVLARNGIGLFVISTFNTDYILTKADQFGRALELLSEEGYHIV